MFTSYSSPANAFRTIVKEGCPKHVLISQSMKSLDGSKMAYEISCLYEDAHIILIADSDTPQPLPEHLFHFQVVQRHSPTFIEDLLFAIGKS
jgi:hypothetical protein